MTETGERLRRALAESRFNWLALTRPEHIGYAAGYRSVGGDIMFGHQMLALVSPQRTIMAGPASDAAALFESGVAPDDYVPFGTFYFESPSGSAAESKVAAVHREAAAAFAAAIAAAGVQGRVGIDRAESAVADMLSEIGPVEDALDWLYSVRAVKTPTEVERLRRAAQLAERGIDAAITVATSGTPETALARVIAAEMAAGGGVPRFLVVTAGERSALSDARATDRPLQAGDLLRFDVGCTFEGYWSDVGRTAVVGSPTELQADRYAAILAGEQAQLDGVRAGLRASDLFRVAVEATEGAGLRPYRRHHCGHAIGTEVYERPIVAPGWDTVLEPGMVLCVETPYYEIGWGGMMVEDTFIVGENGCELLTTSDRSLRVMPV